MNVLSIKKTKIPLLIILLIALIMCIIALFPQSLTLAIQTAQNHLHRELRKPDKWIRIIKATSHTLIYFILTIAFLNFTKWGEQILACAKSVFSHFIAEFKKRESLFAAVTITVFFWVCFYKILDADFLYQDDIFRHATGSRSWIGFSRYISEFLSPFIHTGIKLADIAPITQILAIVLMTLETSIVSYILTRKISVKILFALSLIFINPLFSQCISYRYDAPYMVLAILFSTIPFLFCINEDSNNWIFAFVSFFCLILCNMTYQSSSSIYIVLAIFEVYTRFQRKKNIKQTCIFMVTAILSFAIALIFFKCALMVPQVGEEYFSATVKISSIGNNIVTYLKSVFFLFGGKWTQVFLILIFAISFSVLSKRTEQKNSISIVLTIAMFILSLTLSFGAYIIFEIPLFAPRAFTGFGFLTGILCAHLFINSKKIQSQIPVFCLIVGCVVFYYAYGNALRDQRIYQDFRAGILLSDLNKFSDNSSTKEISIHGDIGLSKGLNVAATNFPIIKNNISPIPSEKNIWNAEFLNFYNFNCIDANLKNANAFPLLISTNYHDIYGKGNIFFIELKK